jgi:hypothetical protein
MQFLVNSLLAPDSTFRDCDWGEAERRHESQKIAAQQAMTRRLQADATLSAEIEQTVKGATEKTRQARVAGQSKRARTKDIRLHGSEEISRIQQMEAERLYAGDSPTATVQPLTDGQADEDCEYVTFPHPTSLHNLRERMMKYGPKPD